jgi:hypothetical protein
VAQKSAAAAGEAVRPSIPYRVAGSVTYGARSEVVLAKGNTVIAVREGDTLDDGYRVEEVAADHVALVYVPLGTVERLPLGADQSPPATPSAAAGSSAMPEGTELPPLPPLPPRPR